VNATLAALGAMLPGRDFDALVIGGSAGAFAALRTILPALDCPPLVAIVVLHQAPQGTDLADLFTGIACLPCVTVEDKMPGRPGAIYFAPPGYHLLLERDGQFALSVDAPVNFSRPSIDVTFESAAEAHGRRLVALILTGASDDGARGLQAVVRRGGMAIVQDPAEAEVPLMPRSAARLASPSATLRLAQVAELFSTWSQAVEQRA
jgi:two-component system, chemotaxis family, protein-glutamate methylesterase/glutaminase